jgi:hypothetical protein
MNRERDPELAQLVVSLRETNQAIKTRIETLQVLCQHPYIIEKPRRHYDMLGVTDNPARMCTVCCLEETEEFGTYTTLRDLRLEHVTVDQFYTIRSELKQ